ncbi:S-adenosylmethionine uptake transporter [Altererythrobacter atlanticus]|uniref:EamA-like transporter family protein n=1 Tax=Croceibacterium atlanticum TaxID=1267766 RepID=A0A0F7KU23_9SPHN|nr:DMT family transporter [Croceibacterium atlanticum]AKH42661.1 EamA-like transporter family protein [Croceibacterium atlanticum]MBB5731438.1 S-adenosylmethionine uptake transporter [Croceibacterium atlanticum]
MTREHHILPFVATLAGVALFSLMDALMKGATIAIGAYSALLLRSAVGFALITPVWLATRKERPSREAKRLHVVRGIVAAAMAFTFFWGIARIPLAEAIALAFTAPLIALYLAAVLLGERIGKRAAYASLMGLAGVVVIAAGRMSLPSADPEAAKGIASVLLSSILYAWNLILQRQQALVARPAEIATWQNGVTGGALLLLAPFLFVTPGRDIWLGISGAAALWVGASMLCAWAYARAEAQVLVPLEYSGFLWAALFGWLFFAEPLRWPLVVGACLIVIACWIAAPRKRPEQTSA